MKSGWKKYIGPGPLIAAAFIGPGTVTVCTLAGVKFGYDLMWSLGLSIIATIVLQEMAARIGLVTQKGLAAVISQTLKKGLLRYFSLLLILMAIVLGNAAYEAGNITGGAMGADLLVNLPVLTLGQLELNLLNMFIGLIALGLLMSGSYSKITGFLTVLVILMSMAFLISAIWVRPSFHLILAGFTPNIDSVNILTIVALIGTTVVPYNLFLHSSMVAKRWSEIGDLKYVRVDTIVSVVLGGLVSMAIIITAASGEAKEVNNAADLAIGLEPFMGVAAKYFIAFGLFAAGITSAITAPLAGSLVVVDCFGWSTDIRKMPMKISIVSILGLGLLFSSLGIRPVQLITFAQLANGILLPLLSAYILWLVNKKPVMQGNVNSFLLNITGVGIWLVTLALGAMSVGKVMGWV